MKQIKWILATMTLFTSTVSFAQNDPVVTINGVIFCEDSIMGTLPDVTVYNVTRQTGTISNSNGEFSIKMSRNDTLIFSTVQHSDTYFFFKETEAFEDRTITVPMEMDNIYIDVVSVMGKGNYEAFKQELLNLKLPDNDPNMVLPIVNRYAEEYATGEGEIKIKGPLTYLSNKIRAYKKSRTKKYIE